MGFLDSLARSLEETATKNSADRSLAKLENEELYYVVLENQDVHKLEQFVSKAICEGWSPLGGISCVGASGGAMFLQAVYRNKK